MAILFALSRGPWIVGLAGGAVFAAALLWIIGFRGWPALLLSSWLPWSWLATFQSGASGRERACQWHVGEAIGSRLGSGQVLHPAASIPSAVTESLNPRQNTWKASLDIFQSLPFPPE
jgi:hypothetical protein